MNIRRHRLAKWMASQSAAARPGGGNHEVSDFRAFPLREPVSGRRYTVIRLQTKSGLAGFGECGPVTQSDIAAATAAIRGKSATSFITAVTNTPLDGGINMALLDITAKACSAPVYRLLGGPTRHKVRAMAPLYGTTDAELAASLNRGRDAGYRAFKTPIPPSTARNHGQAFDRATNARMNALRAAAGEGIDFVLDADSVLTPSDAASVAATLERFHLLWFNEPCRTTNVRTIRKISDETVTPLGFGRTIDDLSVFQDLMRDGLIDILRPDLHRFGISKIRQVATLAETYYTAVAPNHEGGPVATAAATHLAASLPNFFIQHIPWPADDADRRMRAEIAGSAVERVQDGFLPLPTNPGLGVEVSEAALSKYKDNAV